MKPIFFLTSNEGKLHEVRTLLPEVHGIDLDLTEIQELDARKIITAKLAEAQKRQSGTFVVEDTSLYLDEMNGLPGPLVKWFLKALGVEGIAQLAQSCKSAKATAQTLIGYADEDGSVHFFEGVISGKVVPPRGANGFGWDAIFQPDGSEKTFAQMLPEEKNGYSMRRLALEDLRLYLEQGEKVSR